MSMLFGTTILCDACALVAAVFDRDSSSRPRPFARASGSILRGLDSLFPPDADEVVPPC
jgi:hypothetical protein